MTEGAVTVNPAACAALEQFWAHIEAEDERDGPGVDIRCRAFRMWIAALQQASASGDRSGLPETRHADELCSFSFQGFLFVYEYRPEATPPAACILSITPPAGLMDGP